MHFATTHGERIAADLQQPYDPDAYLAEVAMDGYRASPRACPTPRRSRMAELQRAPPPHP